MKFFTKSNTTDSQSSNNSLNGFYNKSQTTKGSSGLSLFTNNALKNTQSDTDEENNGLLSRAFRKFKDNFKTTISSSQNNLKGLTNKMQEVQEAAENWKNFSILFGFGAFFILVSFAFLPVFILVPAKFASLFTLGSVCILLSIAVMKGFKEFVKILIQKEKIQYSIAYIITIFGTLYFSIIQKSYVLAIIFSVAQMFSLGFFVSSSFPGGTNGMKFVTKKLFGFLKGLCCMCFKPKESSFLPI
ncbi:hypothetical protein ABPG72_019236 [Tetrahymena utriculariae]